MKSVTTLLAATLASLLAACATSSATPATTSATTAAPTSAPAAAAATEPPAADAPAADAPATDAPAADAPAADDAVAFCTELFDKVGALGAAREVREPVRNADGEVIVPRQERTLTAKELESSRAKFLEACTARAGEITPALRACVRAAETVEALTACKPI
jgi:hypothetical protein